MSTYPATLERPLTVGDEAPDFDLSSTEDVVLMLKDEVPRTPVLLYLFSGPADLQARTEALREQVCAQVPSPERLVEAVDDHWRSLACRRGELKKVGVQEAQIAFVLWHLPAEPVKRQELLA